MITVQKLGGNASMPRFSRATPGAGRVKIPAIEEIFRNILCQKLVRCLQDQNICMMFPTSPQPLQHRGEPDWENLDILYGV